MSNFKSKAFEGFTFKRFVLVNFIGENSPKVEVSIDDFTKEF